MIVGIDARFYGYQERGLGRYNQKLVESLQKIDRKNQYRIFLLKKHWHDCKIVNKNFKKVLADVPWYSWQEQIWFPRIIKKQKIDLMHFPHFNVPIFYFGNYVITIHDLITNRFSTERATTRGRLGYLVKRLGYGFVIRWALWRAKKVITVSNFVKDDLEKIYGIGEGKVKVVYEGVTKPFQKENCHPEPACRTGRLKKFRDDIGIRGWVILYVGSAYPHKNLENLLRSFKILKSHNCHFDWSPDVKSGRNGEISCMDNLKLVLVGKKEYFYQRLIKWAREKKLDKDVVFAGEVKDKDLAKFYQMAKVFVFPSLMEGFGLPPLEAMSYGVPVVSSNAGPMPEVLGKAAAEYFDAMDEQDMAEKIKDVLLDKEKGEKLKEKGFEQIKKYNWDKMAREILGVYQNIK